MRKIVTLYLICCSLISKADYWTQKADFGGTARYSAVGFSIGAKGYVGTGSTGIGCNNCVKDFWEYDPATNSWAQKADFGGVERYVAVGFSIGNKGYIGTGGASTGNKKDFWEYDPITDTWTQKASFGGTGRSAAVGFSIGNKGYIGTGSNKKDFWEYDPIANSWIQKADLTTSGRNLATGFSDGIKGYIGTGIVMNQFYKNDFWEWDPNTNVWTQKANFGGLPRAEACSFWLCPFGYLGLGTTLISSGTLSDFWKYNIANNTWTQVSNFGNGLREMVATFTISGKAYIGTGWINDNSQQIDFWEYTPDSTCITGIKEFPISNFQFPISPNPVNEFIIINYSLLGKAKFKLRITDATGKNVFETQLSINNNQSTIPLKDFSNGIYFVEISNGKQKAVQKFVKE